MKRAFLLSSILVLATLTISGCGQEKNQTQKDNVLEQNTSSQETVVETNSTIQTETSLRPDYNQDTSYTVIDVSYQEGAINVHYPQIQGVAETEVESKWNDTIKNDIFGEIDALGENGTYNCQFEIATQIEDMLSIIVSGDAYAQGAAHPYNFVKTYNIDLNSGETIRLTDIADVDKIAADIIEGKGYETLGIAKEDFDANVEALNYNKENLVSQLESGSFYQKEGKIILIIGVSHAAGDYARIKLE